MIRDREFQRIQEKYYRSVCKLNEKKEKQINEQNDTYIIRDMGTNAQPRYAVMSGNTVVESDDSLIFLQMKYKICQDGICETPKLYRKVK